MEGASKETIKQLFNQFDQNHDGELTETEIMKVASELGYPITEDKVYEIFNTVDVNHDGAISFDEFYTWWTMCKENSDLAELIKIALKAKKAVLKSSGILQKLQSYGGNLDTATHNVSIKLGQVTIPNTRLHLKGVFKSHEAQDLYNSYSSGLNLNPDSLNIVISIRSKDPYTAKQQIEQMIQQVVQMAGALVEGIDQQLQHIHFSYGIEGDRVKIGISTQHPLVTMVTGPLSEYMQGGEDKGSTFQFDFGAATDLQTLLNSDTSIIHQILQGVSLSMNIKYTKELAEIMRTEVYTKVLAKYPPGTIAQNIFGKILLTLVKSSNFELNLKSPDDLISRIDALIEQKPYKEFGDQSLKITLNAIKEDAPGPISQLVEQLPMASEIIQLFQNYFECDASLVILLPKAGIEAQIQTRGVKEVAQHLLAP